MKLAAVRVWNDRIDSPCCSPDANARAGGHELWQRLHRRDDGVLAGIAVVDRICWHFGVRGGARAAKGQSACRGGGLLRV